MILAIILTTLDLATTLFITQNGGVELNPIPLPILIPIKIFCIIGLIVFTILCKLWKEKFPIIFAILDIWYAIAVIHNLIQIGVHYACIVL